MLQSYGPMKASYDDENVTDPAPQPIIDTPIQNVQGERSVFFVFVTFFFVPAYPHLLPSYGAPKTRNCPWDTQQKSW